MGYLHIDNLYKDQRILMLRECYAMEKIHGTSAHIRWNGALQFHAGGEKHERFVELFDQENLTRVFQELGCAEITIYGEAYGGKQQGQKWRYGEKLRFVVFEVQIGETWLDVPVAHEIATKLGLEFVSYVKVSTDLEVLNGERDAPSVQARRNGVEGDKPREGIVLRPIVEMTTHGHRIISKHKRDEERETNTPRDVKPGRLEVLVKADEIAEEWVTPTRLAHVLDKLQAAQGGTLVNIEQTRAVIDAMLEDVLREGAGEIEDTREARGAISKKTALLFKAKLKEGLLSADLVRKS